MTRDELISYSLTLPCTSADSPFDEDFVSVVLRHKDTGKWFGLIMKLNGEDIVNLKSEPMNSDFLRTAYKGVTAAYHMNKVLWNTVHLSSDVPDSEIENMVLQSYKLTDKKPRRTKNKDERND